MRKRILCFALISVLCLCMLNIAIAGDIRYDQWTIKSYIDDFGDDTGEMYIMNYYWLKGTFSNSATTNSDAYISFIIDQTYSKIRLWNYNENFPVKNNFSDTMYYSIKVRGATGTLETTGFQPGHSEYIGIMNPDEFDEMLRNNSSNISIYIEDSTYHLSSYLFKDLNLSGFSTAMGALYGNKPKINSIGIHIVPFSAGDKSEQAINHATSALEDCHYQIGAAWWCDENNNEIVNPFVLAEGGKYHLVVAVLAEEGYEFPDNSDITVQTSGGADSPEIILAYYDDEFKSSAIAVKMNVELPIHDHDLVTHKGTTATCIKTGTEAYWECSICKKLFSDADGSKEIEEPKAIPLAAHTLTEHKEVKASCTEAGTEAYWECSVCEKLFSDAEGTNEIEEPKAIPLAAHTLTEHNEVKASCIEAGTEAYWECTVCEKLFSDAEGTNEIEEPKTIPLAVHTLTEHKEIKASCKETGTKAYWECSVCHKLFSDGEGTTEIEKPETIPLAAHKLTEHKEIKASCKETGTEAYWECSVCEKLFSDANGSKEIDKPKEIPLAVHMLVEHKKVDATISSAGTEAYWECSVCHKLFGDAEGKKEIKEAIVIPKAKLGDLTGDGELDGRDAIHLMKYLSGDLDEAEMAEIKASGTADINQDRKIDELDLLRLIKMLAEA